MRIAPARTRHPRYLSLQERTLIADLLRERRTVRSIAVELGRSPSTVSREIRRNSDGKGRYRPQAADQAAVQRTARPRRRRLWHDPQLRGVVSGLLAKRWSPEQVAHDLRVRFPGEPDWWLCAESIYQAIYDPGVELTRPSRRRRRRRRLQVQGLERRGTVDGDEHDLGPARRGRGPCPGRALGG